MKKYQDLHINTEKELEEVANMEATLTPKEPVIEETDLQEKSTQE